MGRRGCSCFVVVSLVSHHSGAELLVGLLCVFPSTNLAICSPFAGWFQPAQTSQPTVFFSHNKPTPASANQLRNQPANRPVSVLWALPSKAASCCFFRWIHRPTLLFLPGLSLLPRPRYVLQMRFYASKRHYNVKIFVGCMLRKIFRKILFLENNLH